MSPPGQGSTKGICRSTYLLVREVRWESALSDSPTVAAVVWVIISTFLQNCSVVNTSVAWRVLRRESVLRGISSNCNTDAELLALYYKEKTTRDIDSYVVHVHLWCQRWTYWFNLKVGDCLSNIDIHINNNLRCTWSSLISFRCSRTVFVMASTTLLSLSLIQWSAYTADTYPTKNKKTLN